MSPSNPDGDILQGAESVKSEQLRHPGDGRSGAGGQAAAAGFQEETADPEPRVVTISPRVPVAESIRSTTGAPVQFQEEAPQRLSSNQFIDETGNSAGFFSGAANAAPFRAAAANDALFFDGQFQQQGGGSGGFVGQTPGFGIGSQNSGFDGRSVGVNGQAPAFTNQGFGFGGQQTSGFAPDFSGLNPNFGGPGVGFDGRNAEFAGRSAGFVQPDPRFGGQTPAFVPQDPRFVAQEPVFNAPPPDFSSGVPFAFREFGGVPTNQGVSPATSTDTGAGVRSAGVTGQVGGDVGGTATSTGVRQQEPTLEASNKVGRLSGNGGQLSGRNGNNPSRFAPVVAEENNFQQRPQLGNQQIGFQQNGFQPIGGGFPAGGRTVAQGVNSLQPVAQHQNRFPLPSNSPGFSPDGRFIQGNLEILFPQQFRENSNGFQPANPGVFGSNQDGFVTDQDRFSLDQRRVLPAHQGFFPGQTSFPQERDRPLSDQNNFQATDRGFPEGQRRFPQQQGTSAQDRRGFPPEANSPAERGFIFPDEEEQRPATFGEPLNARGELSPRLPVRGRSNVKLDKSPADEEPSQQADPTILDKLAAGQRRRSPKSETRINRGKFPLPRDQFFEAKKDAKLVDEKPVGEETNQNKEILRHALQTGEGKEPVQDEPITEHTRFRPSQVRFLPGPGGNSLNRDIFPLDQDGFQRRPNEEGFRSNSNTFPSEHRSFPPRFSPSFTPNRNQFSPSERFPQDEGIFARDQDITDFNGDRFPVNQNRFVSDQNELPLNQNRFVSNQNQFAPAQNGFTPADGRFPVGSGRFVQSPVEQNRITTTQERFTPSRNRFTPNQGQFTPKENELQQDRGRFFGQDSFGQNAQQSPVQPPFQSNQGRFRQNLNSPNLRGGRFQQNERGFLNNQNQFQQNDVGFTPDVNNFNQGFDNFGDFERPRVPHNPRASNQNSFVRNPNQIQPQLVPGSFPSQFPSSPGRDAFSPPQKGNIQDNRIVDEQDVFEATTVPPPPRIVAPLPKAMI